MANVVPATGSGWPRCASTADVRGKELLISAIARCPLSTTTERVSATCGRRPIVTPSIVTVVPGGSRRAISARSFLRIASTSAVLRAAFCTFVSSAISAPSMSDTAACSESSTCASSFPRSAASLERVMLSPTRATGISASASTVSPIRTVNRFAREGRTYLSCRSSTGRIDATGPVTPRYQGFGARP